MITAGLCKWHTSSPPSPPRRRPSRTVMARRCDKHSVPPLHIVPLPGMLTSSDGMLSTPSHKLCSSIHLYTYPPNCCFFSTTCSHCPMFQVAYSVSSLACFSVHSAHPPLPDVTSSYSTSYIPQLTCTLSTQLLLSFSLPIFSPNVPGYLLLSSSHLYVFQYSLPILFCQMSHIPTPIHIMFLNSLVH